MFFPSFHNHLPQPTKQMIQVVPVMGTWATTVHGLDAEDWVMATLVSLKYQVSTI